MAKVLNRTEEVEALYEDVSLTVVTACWLRILLFQDKIVLENTSLNFSVVIGKAKLVCSYNLVFICNLVLVFLLK